MVKEVFGFAQQERDPEAIRKRRLLEIEKELKRERNKRDALLFQKITPENEYQHAVDLGVVSSNIVRLRDESQTLIR